jgi:TPP-dependent trihydroxycyclohexane-1,2-dione (THcHDO) dehydratase
MRLTAAQALVRFLAVQWSERDGQRRRVVPGIFGIFGHGNVCGLGPALEEDEGRSLSYFQPKNEQSMVHAAVGFARANGLLSTLACSASIGPGSTNLLTGAATATVNRVPVLLLPSDTFANRRQGPVMQALEHPLEADLRMNSADLSIVSRREGRPAPELLQEHLEQRVPARRLGTPDEVARLFAYLASYDAGFITGTVVKIDGGELAG